MKRFHILNYLHNILYNFDRLIASLFGAPPQETISSELGRHLEDPVAKAGCEILDKIDPGHCEDAVKHADALDKVDDKIEK